MSCALFVQKNMPLSSSNSRESSYCNSMSSDEIRSIGEKVNCRPEMVYSPVSCSKDSLLLWVIWSINKDKFLLNIRYDLVFSDNDTCI